VTQQVNEKAHSPADLVGAGWPLMQSGHMTCAAAAQLRVSRGQPARPVTVICPIP